MKRIDTIFILHRARSDLFSRYRPGEVPYVGNGLVNNAVVGFVTPLPIDKIFNFMGIVVSAFCEATVQAPPFVACGRAGNGLSILEPRESMTAAQMAFYAAYINLAIRWRFSWSWQTTVDRLKRLMIPDEVPTGIKYPVHEYIPSASKASILSAAIAFQSFALSSIFDLKAGDYHNVSELPSGPIPIISCGEADNGIAAFVAVPPENIYEQKLTIAFNGMNTLTAKYHPYPFAAKDDVAICIPLKPLRISTLFLIQVMMAREKWRYSYYRKCFMEKLNRQSVRLPVKNDEIDEDCIEAVVSGSRYWKYLEQRLSPP